MKILTIVLMISKCASLCHICGPRGNQKLTDPLKYINEAKATCAAIAVKVSKTVTTPGGCDKAQKDYTECCDGSSKGSTLAPVEIQIPQTRYKGPYEECDLCRDGVYPSAPSHVIHLLYIGASSCRNYYIAGKEGKIPTHLCDPLRFFANSPCGCMVKTMTRTADPRQYERIGIATLVFMSIFAAAAIGILTLALRNLRRQETRSSRIEV